MTVRPKIQEIVDNIDKFEVDTNDNLDAFFTGFGLRLIISFCDEVGATHTKISFQLRQDGGYIDIYLTQDEEGLIYSRLHIQDLLIEREKKFLEKQSDLLNLITF